MIGVLPRRTVLLLGVVLLALVVGCRPRSTLPVLWAAPSFALVDQAGQAVASAELGGKVVLANFIFTNCTDVCPLLTGTMARIRDELRAARLLGDKAVLLSFSVDPEHDTPALLADYGARFDARPDEWKLLTGDKAQIDELLTVGFKVGAPRVARPGAAEIAHTDRFALIDRDGQLRALFRGDDLNVGQVIEEIRRLSP